MENGMPKLPLPDRLKRALHDFTGALAAACGDNLISVIVYGSAPRGEFAPPSSDINLLVVLKDADLEVVRTAAPLIQKRRFRIMKPIFMTEAYIAHSRDVFPIEYLDMKERYIVLSGRDILREVEPDIKNLRFQCEHELKSKVLNLRRVYLERCGDGSGDLALLLLRSFTSIAHILRNALRLKGGPAARSNEELLAALTEQFGIDAAVWGRILAAKRGVLRLKRREAEELLIRFVRDLEKAAGIIDRASTTCEERP